MVDSDVTTLVITSNTFGPLTIHDTTLIDGNDVPAQPSNAIRTFTDGTFATPTFFGVIGRDLFIRADAASCNADPNSIETRTVVISGANGEREQVTAVNAYIGALKDFWAAQTDLQASLGGKLPVTAVSLNTPAMPGPQDSMKGQHHE